MGSWDEGFGDCGGCVDGGWVWGLVRRWMVDRIGSESDGYLFELSIPRIVRKSYPPHLSVKSH